MAIIQCPSCGSNISNQAVQCPKCGCQIQGSENQYQNSTQGKDYSGLEWYMWILFLCVGWIVPLVYYFVKKDKAPKRASQALICMWIDLAYWIVWLCI